ncbi:MAG: nucleotidyltransferase domain-containing protein [bacterium]
MSKSESNIRIRAKRKSCEAKNIQKTNSYQLEKIMRLDKEEKEALKFALTDFKGAVYLFGSRLDETKKGGDIDILLISQEKINPLKLSLKIQARFFLRCEEKIDIIVYDDKSAFCQEVLKNAKRLDITGI